FLLHHTPSRPHMRHRVRRIIKFFHFLIAHNARPDHGIISFEMHGDELCPYRSRDRAYLSAHLDTIDLFLVTVHSDDTLLTQYTSKALCLLGKHPSWFMFDRLAHCSSGFLSCSGHAVRSGTSSIT